MNTKRLLCLTAMVALTLSGVTYGQAIIGTPYSNSASAPKVAPTQKIVSTSSASPKVVVTPMPGTSRVIYTQDKTDTVPIPAPANGTTPAPVIEYYPENSSLNGNCGGHCGPKYPCDCRLLEPWSCDDLKMEPVERKHHCHGCGCGGGGLFSNFLFCPDEEEDEDCDVCGNGNGNGNGNGENGDGNGNGENGNGENGNGENGEDEEEEPEDPPEPVYTNFLMRAINCCSPQCYEHMEEHGWNFYGFIQGGFTGNFDSPRDRLNFGVNNNNRSNAFLMNMAYISLGKDVNTEKWDWGFRVDVLGGADAFENASLELGFLDQAWSEGTFSYGIDVPQFYADFHMPILTEQGVTVRVGHIYTLMGYEVWPGNATPFYSRSWESFYGIPFTHMGVDTITYLSDTLTMHNGMYMGWDVTFDDNNRGWSYMGGLSWTSCDENTGANAFVMFGPEQDDNNGRYRSLFTMNFSHTFGSHNQWNVQGSGILGFDPKAGANGEDTQWYGCAGYLFYTLDPRVILGCRGEWFADPQGFRTGFNTDYYAITAGVTFKPFQNLWIRPEVRWDWAGYDDVLPFNDTSDSLQTTAGFDIILNF